MARNGSLSEALSQPEKAEQGGEDGAAEQRSEESWRNGNKEVGTTARPGQGAGE